jgi:hypothetical protein
VYRHNKTAPGKQLVSTLTKFTDPIADMTSVQLVSEYERVGQISFESKLLKGVQHPCPGYPSFKYLGIQELMADHKVVQKVNFVQWLVVMNQCLEETQPQELEKYLNHMVKTGNTEVYVNFPWQQEAFPMYFEDKFHIFTIFGDMSKGKPTF